MGKCEASFDRRDALEIEYYRDLFWRSFFPFFFFEHFVPWEKNASLYHGNGLPPFSVKPSMRILTRPFLPVVIVSPPRESSMTLARVRRARITARTEIAREVNNEVVLGCVPLDARNALEIILSLLFIKYRIEDMRYP